MPKLKLPKNSYKKLFSLISVTAITSTSFWVFMFATTNTVYAATLTNGSVTLSDSRPNQDSTYSILFSNVTDNVALECISVEFATTATGGTPPPDFVSTSATLNIGSSNFVAWSNQIVDISVNGTVEITFDTATPADPAARSLIIENVNNGSVSQQAYFLILQTYSNSDCSTGLVDSGVIGFIYTEGQLITINVDPELTFTITGVGSGQTINGATTNDATTNGTVEFSTITTAQNRIAAHDLEINTNAPNGYNVYIRYTQPLTNTANPLVTIPNIAGTLGTPTTPFPTGATPGNAGFGYTFEGGPLNANEWIAFGATNPGQSIMAATGQGGELRRVGYQVGIDTDTSGGLYTTILIYTAVPQY